MPAGCEENLMNLFDFELIPDSPNGKDEPPRLKSAKMDHNPERHEISLAVKGSGYNAPTRGYDS